VYVDGEARRIIVFGGDGKALWLHNTFQLPDTANHDTCYSKPTLVSYTVFSFLGSRASRNHGMAQSTGMAVLDHDQCRDDLIS
jgi:hypothetical protein